MCKGFRSGPLMRDVPPPEAPPERSLAALCQGQPGVSRWESRLCCPRLPVWAADFTAGHFVLDCNIRVWQEQDNSNTAFTLFNTQMGTAGDVRSVSPQVACCWNTVTVVRSPILSCSFVWLRVEAARPFALVASRLKSPLKPRWHHVWVYWAFYVSLQKRAAG